MAVEEHEYQPEELDAGHETVARRLQALQGGLRLVERGRPRPLVVDLAAADVAVSPGDVGTVQVPVSLPAPEPLTDGSEWATSAPLPSPQPPPEPEPPLVPGPPAAERPSIVRSFAAWWRAESAARAEERHRREAETAAEKARAAQASLGLPAASADQTQVIRSVMTLTEERFQALGLRSDRLHDELLGISRAIAELREVAAASGTISLPAAEAADDLQERLDTLLLALAKEFRRRSEEIERSLSAQMAIQNAELAMLLEDALTRMRSLIPEEMSKVAAEVSATVERAVAAIPPPVSVFGPSPRADR